ncbi:MAG: S8 family serine peptidase [Clostridia bacterium]|nr:S8 family serine peptidase [Clostridia bacterium]
MTGRKTPLRILALLLAAFLVLPTAAQGAFAAADKEITVIVEMNSEPLLALNSETQLDEAAQQRYSAKTQAERDKVLDRAEKSVGSMEVKYTYADVFNGAAVTIRESELEELKSVYGVANVYESAKIKLAADDIDDEHLEEFNTRAKEMINLASAREQGYEGEGMLIAIIDGGFETSHENFKAIDGSDNKLDKSRVADVIQSGALSTSKVNKNAYINSKIPYYYSYALESNNGEPLTTAEPDHGSHVAGIAAGNGDKVQGVAPKAQLALMQIAFESDEAYIHDVIAAINDAVTLGADAMNMSFGENWVGADFEEYVPMTQAIENARNAGVFVAVAAGNEGYLYSETSDPYYGTDCYPSTAPGATAVGAANSDVFSSMSNATLLFDGKAYDFQTLVNGTAYGGDYPITEPMKLGVLRTDFTLLFKNKSFVNKFVPVVKGGSGYNVDRLLDQLTKLYSLNAAACLISRSLFDEIEADLYVHSWFYMLPTILVLEDADFSAAASAGTVTVIEGFPDGMAYFSTWGFDRDLDNIVDISAPGTDVYSSITDNGYTYLGGTSMATPFVCGSAALMAEKIYDSGIKIWGGEKVKFIENALKNTAVPYADENGEFLSPRLQGAGLLNIGAAVRNQTVLVDALRGGEAELHLGTSLSDQFSFSFKLMNRSAVDKTYDVSAAFTTDSYEEYKDEDDEGNEIAVRYFDPETRVALKATVSGLDKPITVKAGNSVIVDVKVSLDAEQTASFAEVFPNGFYVDGFLVAAGEGETLSIPMTGFYGDYYALPAISDITAFFMPYDDDALLLTINAVTTCSLSKAQAVVTDANGAVVWSKEMTDLSYGRYYSLDFQNMDDDENIIPLDLKEGNYHVTVTVLAASKGAQPQTYEDDFYFPGFRDPEILSWELTPTADGNYQIRAVSARKDLERVDIDGVTFQTIGERDSAWFELAEETDEGFVYTGKLFVKTVDDPTAHYDVEFVSTIGRTQLFKANVSNFIRWFVELVYNVRSFFLLIFLIPAAAMGF